MHPDLNPAGMPWQKTVLFYFLGLLPFLLVVGVFFDPGHWIVWFLSAVGISLFPLYGNLWPNCQWFGPVVTSFQTMQKEVWLTIDDGPDPQYTQQTLDVLRRHGVRATFFLVGEHVCAHPDFARAIPEQGHSIGNHSYSHCEALFWCMGPRGASRQIDRATEMLKNVTGRDTVLFRAPVGMANYFVHWAAAQRRQIMIGWSARGFDTMDNHADAVVERIFRNVRPGAILLLHEHGVLNLRSSANHEVLEKTLDRLNCEGYRCVIPDLPQLQ